MVIVCFVYVFDDLRACFRDFFPPFPSRFFSSFQRKIKHVEIRSGTRAELDFLVLEFTGTAWIRARTSRPSSNSAAKWCVSLQQMERGDEVPQLFTKTPLYRGGESLHVCSPLHISHVPHAPAVRQSSTQIRSKVSSVFGLFPYKSVKQ